MLQREVQATGQGAFALLFSLLGLLASSDAASAGWEEEKLVSTCSGDPFNGQCTRDAPPVGIDESGVITTASVPSFVSAPLTARRMELDGSLTSPVTIAATYVPGSNSLVGVEPDGDATIGYGVTPSGGFPFSDMDLHTRAFASTGTLGTTLSPFTTPSPNPQNESASGPVLQRDSGGNTTTAWLQTSSGPWRIMSARSTDTTQSAAVELFSPDKSTIQSARPPVSAIGSNDVVTVAWSWDFSFGQGVYARQIEANGQLRPLREIEAPGGFAGYNTSPPSVSTAADGSATIAWQAYNAGLARWEVRIRKIGTDSQSTLGPTITVAASPKDPDCTCYPSVNEAYADVAEDGTTIVTWATSTENPNGNRDWVTQTRRVAPDGSLGSTRTLSQVSTSARSSTVAVMPSGESLVLWDDNDGLRSSLVAEDGTFAPAQTLGAGSAANPIQVSDSGVAAISHSALAVGGIDRFLRRYVPWPETRIESGPDDLTNQTPSFTFSSPDPTIGFECRFDNQAFAPCTSGATFDTSDGEHTLNVRARNADYVDPSPAARSFTLDTEPPSTLIKSAPKGTVKSSSATIKFESAGDDRLRASYECRLDKGKAKKCRSPYKAKKLKPGKHTFQVTGTDEAGNTDPSPAKATWKVKKKKK